MQTRGKAPAGAFALTAALTAAVAWTVTLTEPPVALTVVCTAALTAVLAAALTAALIAVQDQLGNIGTIGQLAQVIVGFLTQMQGQLDDITNALGAIHEDVKAMRQELLRLTGKPVLEVMETYRQSVLRRHLSMLPSDVYIEAQGLLEGDDAENRFEDTDQNRVDLKRAVVDFLLSAKDSHSSLRNWIKHELSTLLITGAAGSGQGNT